MKISILMAVYNAERFLDESIGSVLRQTHDDWELLCTDDCSTDASFSVLSHYAEKDARVKVYRNEKNRGIAVSRNVALSHATGDVVMFLDADDWLGDNTLELLSQRFADERVDTVLLRCRFVEPDGSQHDYQQQKFTELSGKVAFVLSLSWQIHGIYAVRAEIHHRYTYDTSCRHYSDENVTRIHYYVSRLVADSDAVYYYRQNPVSVSHAVSVRRMDMLRANTSMSEQIRRLDCSREVLADYENYRWLNILGTYLWYYNNRESFDADERIYCLSEIRAAWKTVDASLLYRRNSLKPGYLPIKKSWQLFHCQLVLFAFFRKLIGR